MKKKQAKNGWRHGSSDRVLSSEHKTLRSVPCTLAPQEKMNGQFLKFEKMFLQQ
jgi:hypothetical protein